MKVDRKRTALRPSKSDFRKSAASTYKPLLPDVGRKFGY